MSLIEVGFWALETEFSYGVSIPRVNPQECVDFEWFSKALSDRITTTFDFVICKMRLSVLQRLIWYLKFAVVIESYEHGYSYCRFLSCEIASENVKAMGACTFTDGTYCWPEGYYHYIMYHCVKPPQKFLEHVENNFQHAVQSARLREAQSMGLWQWDPESMQAETMPKSNTEWILKHTNVRPVSVQSSLVEMLSWRPCHRKNRSD
uniref:Uncharacterized protein AlNc14C56G4274 n=1 Tax=Albugo laibachii Nc14 TaxID=890382 RepID=F0WC91_9STRA|nr:conserved hypothetical protein [Albugo laibachii Nc14]|eukprot:CCA18804.1 conserved hypothetical protein [Albugo laibachii Nc14]